MNELLLIYKIDILRFRTKLFLLIFNVLPDLYCIRIFKNSILYLSGMQISVLLTYIKDGLYCDNTSSIQIGKGSFINRNVSFEGDGNVCIGDFCQIGPNTQFVTTNHLDRQNDVTSNIQVGNNVWIGAGCIILPGVVIGNNVNIAAGSIVRGTLIDGILWAGNPAKKRR